MTQRPKRVRKASLVVASVGVAAVMAFSAVGWACTDHLGVIWFCSTSTGCTTYETKESTFAVGSTAYARGDGLRANKQHSLRYITAPDLDTACMASQLEMAKVTTDGWGNFGPTAVTMPGVAGSWTACAFFVADDGRILSSNHETFSTF